MTLERLSIELGERCSKACWFCYAKSHPNGTTTWNVEDVVSLVTDCARHGLRAVSFGGGEPLESPLLFPALEALRGRLFRSFTTNGLPLDALMDRVVAAAPDKVHVSLHFPSRRAEVMRVIRQVHDLAARGIRSGVNLLVQRSKLDDARRAALALHAAGIDNQRIVFLPMRGQDTPSPQDVALVADGPFQSMTCLEQCGRSPRFCSLSASRTAAWCSYTTARRQLTSPTHAALLQALDGLGITFCGDAPIRLRRSAEAM